MTLGQEIYVRFFSLQEPLSSVYLIVRSLVRSDRQKSSANMWGGEMCEKAIKCVGHYHHPSISLSLSFPITIKTKWISMAVTVRQEYVLLSVEWSDVRGLMASHSTHLSMHFRLYV